MLPLEPYVVLPIVVYDVPLELYVVPPIVVDDPLVYDWPDAHTLMVSAKTIKIVFIMPTP